MHFEYNQMKGRFTTFLTDKPDIGLMEREVIVTVCPSLQVHSTLVEILI